LDLAYIIPQASWRSVYQIRVESKEEKCILVYQGVIRNATGENWDNVNLTLSTAEPSKGGEPPKIPGLVVYYQDYPPVVQNNNFFYMNAQNQKQNAKHLSYSDYESFSDEEELDLNMEEDYFEQKNRRFRSNVSKTKESKKPSYDYLMEKEKYGKSEKKMKSKSMKSKTEEVICHPEPVLPEKEDIVDVNQTGICATFTISRPCTVHSDSKPHRVTIANIPLETKLEYVVVPSMSLSAYLKAVTENISPFTLLGGKISVFIDNFFVSTTSLKLTSPGERMELYLGIDGSIKVEYVSVPQRHGQRSRVLQKMKTKTVSQITTIKNNKDIPVQLSILEQLPVTSDPTKIKINILETTEPDHILTERNNLIRWDFILAPREEKKIPYDYEIEYSHDKHIDIQRKVFLETS